MFRIKICGVTSIDDALAACDAGADAIGLNFYEPSPRSVSLALAARIACACPVQTVGVFVNHSAERIAEIHETVGLDYVQLHGDERPATITTLAPRKVLKAFRCKDDVQEAFDYLEECRQAKAALSAVLLDAYAVGEYGGTGKAIDWNMVRQSRTHFLGQPVILAGGLTPENVAQAIETSQADAVDTASGVEEQPGKKSVEKIKRFVSEAKKAFEQIDLADAE